MDKFVVSPSLKRALLIAEFTILYIVTPLGLFAFAKRHDIYMALEAAGLYSFIMLYRAPGFSWRGMWHGIGWTREQKKFALVRFLLVATLIGIVTYIALPDKFMRFPLDRFKLWYAVMILYPVLSVIPQELFFRSFYFMRYRAAVAERWSGLVTNGLAFGFSHIVLNNWIAPTCCAIAGVILAHSYRQHRSLKWAVIEHAAYGNWVFTVGFGWYFFTGNWRG